MATKSETSVDVRIGLVEGAAELHYEIAQSAADISATVTKSLESGSTLSLTDAKGRQVIVAVAKIAFVEIGSAESRKVGFNV